MKGTLTTEIQSLDCLKLSKNEGEQAVYKAFLDDSDGVQPREIAAKLDKGVEGDCDLCGEWTSRLIGGACAPCCDRYKLK